LNIVSDNGVEKKILPADITSAKYVQGYHGNVRGKKDNSCMNGNNDIFAKMSNNSH